MSYRVELEKGARKEFLDLPAAVGAQLAEVIDDLKENPRPPGAKKLSGVDGYRVRKGAYRILYTIDDGKRLIRIYRIGHRKDIYRH